MKSLITILMGLFLCVSVTGADKAKPLPKDLKSLTALAEKGDARAYFYGKGLPKDIIEGVKWYRRAAEQGHANAQNNLGWMYREGYGVPKDFKEAVKWTRKAAEQGYASAQYNLGLRYDNGEGVPEDDKEAVKLYRKAADQRHAKAQYTLGVMYWRGEGTEKDMAKCLAWWILAAKQENQLATEWKPKAVRKMTPAQIAKAEALVKEMVKKEPEAD